MAERVIIPSSLVERELRERGQAGWRLVAVLGYEGKARPELSEYGPRMPIIPMRELYFERWSADNR